MKYINIYQRYLKNAYPKEANSKLVVGLMLLHHLKELCYLHSMQAAYIKAITELLKIDEK